MEDLHRGERGVWCRSGRAIITAWNKGICAPDLITFDAFTKPMAVRYPDGWLVVSYSFGDAPLPDPEARKVMLERSSIVAQGYRGTVVNLVGEGFFLSVARSILAAMAVVRSGRSREHVVKDLDETLTKAHELAGIDGATLKPDIVALLAECGRKPN